LYLNYARIEMCRDFYAVDENCPDEHWREIAREIY
jgi:predicted SnoaL-like aldol condensation-catalyzing enzyme